jgi:hypothetical protein
LHSRASVQKRGQRGGRWASLSSPCEGRVALDGAARWHGVSWPALTPTGAAGEGPLLRNPIIVTNRACSGWRQSTWLRGH